MIELRSPIAFVGAAVALAGVAGCAFIVPRAAAAGWLVAFVFAAQILVGSLSLLMIHKLTSGGWGEIIAPVAVPATMAIPLLFLVAVPVFVAIPALYSWALHP